MILRHCTVPELIRRIDGKKLVCFGAGKGSETVSDDFPEYGLERHFAYIVDNNSALWGTEKTINATKIRVCSPEKLFAEADRDVVVLITNTFYLNEIYEQLSGEDKLQNSDCYIAAFLHEAEYRGLPSFVPSDYRANPTPVIPKVIHYFWFGGSPLPERYRVFVESWRKHCYDYEIVEWNEATYDVDRHPYTREAAKAKIWSKVASYARLDVVYQYGGVSMDTDVQVIRPLDELLFNDAYIGFENRKTVNSGSGFGAVKQAPMIGKLRDYYDDIPFLNGDGSYNLTVCPEFETQALVERGLTLNADFQIIDGLTVYPAEFFSPFSPFTGLSYVTNNTYSIHHYDGTWKTEGHYHESRALSNVLFKIAMENEANPSMVRR